MDLREIFLRAGPAPIVTSAEDAIGELVERGAIFSERIRREAAVPHYFRGVPLIGLSAVIGQDLKVGVAVNVNKAGSSNQAGAIYYLC
ncbi:MAG: hypothetical protein ABJF23_32620 [Bryobacteraceae bacterium]